MTPEQQATLGAAAREWFEANDRAFQQRFLEAIAAALPASSHH
jgi:hypothetical protein